jgi:glucose-1-phosphate cytidylyltransferase
MTYGDGVADVDINALISQHEGSGMTATLTAIQPSGRYGVLDLDEDKNCVVGFREKAREDANWINAEFILKPDVFEYIDGDLTYFEREPMIRLSTEGKLGACMHYGYWQCMDMSRDSGALECLWNEGNAPWKEQ